MQALIELLERILNFLDIHLHPWHSRMLLIAWVFSIPVLIIDLISKITKKARGALREIETSTPAMLKIAQRNEKQGNLDTAAQAYLRANEPEKAMDCFRRCDHPERAADVAINEGLFATAAQDFETAELKESAANAWAKAGNFTRAEEIFEGLGNVLPIAKMYEDAEDYAAATECYKRLNMSHKIVELLELEGHFGEAAAVLSEDIRLGMATMGGYSRPDLSDNDRDPDDGSPMSPIEHALKLYGLAREPDSAARLLEDVGYRREAGAYWEQAGEYRQAAELYEAAEDPEAAARAWEQAGHPDRSAANLAEAARDGGDLEAAARHFMAANQPVMAAEMLERAGQIGEAAAAFEKAGSLVRAAVLYKVVAALPDAARCLEASEQPAEAAACHEQLGNYEKAAELLLQIGNASEAGKALLQAGNHDAALRAFQQVASADAGYHHACRQIGIILLEQGHTALAIRKLEEGLAGAMAESDTLDGYYALGYANQEVGQLDAAIAAFEVILGHDLEFRDTLDRCRQVRGQAEAAKQSEAMDQVSTATMNEPITEPANSASTPAEDRANDTDGEDEAPLLDDARLASPDRDD